MFCATFYSYKGGVGRSLALANVAVLLAQRGKKVLVVDFDLEAPGLTTLSPFAPADGGKGVVDLVSDYVERGGTPPLDDYIHTCVTGGRYDELNAGFEEISIDIMPAGRDDDDGYGQRLSRIDWNLLYEKQDGFLMMENIRAHWQQRGYDYVLIDSRTGHTDVGGICTRQLPDLVVAVFFPNEQNLIGLRQIVRDVRSSGARPKDIELLFVASRVPRLDDEHGHLKRRMERFQEELGYSENQLVTIEHYDSLMLLNQSMFVLDRVSSGLATQYRELAGQLVQYNDEDADGAVAFAMSVASRRIRVRVGDDESKHGAIVSRLEAIGKAHKEDCVVQHELSRAYYRLRDLASGADAVDAAIAAIPATRTTRPVDSDRVRLIANRMRLKIYSELDRDVEALESARAILGDAKAPEAMVIDAMLAIASIDPGALQSTKETPAIAEASAERILAVARQLAQAPGLSAVAAEFTEMALKEIVDVRSAQVVDIYTSQMTLIAGGRFERAAMIAEPILADSVDLITVFNTAIAQWGRDGRPNEATFQQAAGLFDRAFHEGYDPNWYQCLALTNAVLGRTEAMSVALEQARAAIERTGRREFSCWSFALVSPAQFIAHLAEIAEFGNRGAPQPVVFTQHEAA